MKARAASLRRRALLLRRRVIGRGCGIFNRDAGEAVGGAGRPMRRTGGRYAVTPRGGIHAA